jgi:hypothetical protein
MIESFRRNASCADFGSSDRRSQPAGRDQPRAAEFDRPGITTGCRRCPPENLFSAELTGCSMSTDNCHDADEREFAKSVDNFSYA